MQNTALMRRIERTGNLLRQRQRLLYAQGSNERRTLHEFEHQIIRPDVENLADVGMIQGRDRAGFPFETCSVRLIDLLDSDNAIEPRVAGFPHLSHAASANGRNDFVRAEFVARHQAHSQINSVYPNRVTPCWACPIWEQAVRLFGTTNH